MLRRKYVTHSLLVLAALFFGTVSQAKADPLVFTITNPTGTVAPGETVDLLATLFNSNADGQSSAVATGYIQAVLNGPPGVVTDYAPFFGNLADQVIPDGATLGPSTFYRFYVGFDVPRGRAIFGTFSFSYNSSLQVDQATNTQSILYIVGTEPPPSTVPEQATVLLLGTGFAGIGGMIKRKRQGKSE